MSVSISELGIPHPISPNAQHFLDLASLADPTRSSLQEPTVHSCVTRLDSLHSTEHIPSEVVAYAFELSLVINAPYGIIEHKPSLSTREKTAILEKHFVAERFRQEAPLEPLKTVTLQVSHHGEPVYFLVCGIGDFHIDHQAKQDLAVPIKKFLNTDANVVRKTTINPPELDPRDFGTQVGVVSPFVRVPRYRPMKGLLYYVPSNYEGFVAVAASFTDTFIVKRAVLSLTINWWQEEGYLGVPFQTVRRGNVSQTLSPA